MPVPIICGEWHRDVHGELHTKECSYMECYNEDDAKKWIMKLAGSWLKRVGTDEDSHGMKMKLHVEYNRVELGTISEGYYQRYGTSPDKQSSL